MNKIQKFHHSVSETGNIQVRIVDVYEDDEGNVIDKKYSDAYTPENVRDMAGWDDRSKNIVSAIISPNVLALFAEEVQPSLGAGLEEIVSHDRVVYDDGSISVRRIVRILDDGKEISKKYHRYRISPGDNFDSCDVISKAVAAKIQTKEVITKFKDDKNKLKKIEN